VPVPFFNGLLELIYPTADVEARRFPKRRRSERPESGLITMERGCAQRQEVRHERWLTHLAEL
jgi:hypothetical protein